jgi:hypothetical protein
MAALHYRGNLEEFSIARVRVNTNTVILAKARIQVVIRAEGHKSRCFASANALDSGFRQNDGRGDASV